MITGVNLFIDLNAVAEIQLDLESSILDFKETFDDKALKTLAAFANTYGGIVLIGVCDDKTIKGVNYKNQDIETITNQIIDSLNIHPDIKLEEHSGKHILKIEVQKSNTPKSFRGKYYKRVGNTTREMQGEELKDFFLKDTNWDSLTGDYTPDEIDQNTVKMFLSMAKKANRITAFNDDDDILNILERLKLINNGKITNAAIMLFGIDPQKYFINALVRVGRFKGETIIISDKVIDGNLFNQAINAEAAIQSLINVRYEITGKLQRDEIWDYPLDAIREMLLNAIIHRDYFKYNVQTQIKIFDDHIWCFNIGGLPQGITLTQLKAAHSSVPRNPLIMDIFYRSGLVEECGSGIQRINEAFLEAKLPEPEFIDELVSFTVIFRKDMLNEKSLKNLGLNERQIKAVFYLKEKGKIANKDYQILNNTTRETSKRDLEELFQKGVFKRIGEGRSVYYEINGSNVS